MTVSVSPYAANLDALSDSLAQTRHRMTIGLRPLTPSEWIVDLADGPAQLVEKQQLLNQHTDVVATLPESSAAQQELLALVVTHVLTHFPTHYSLTKSPLNQLLDGAVHNQDCMHIAPPGIDVALAESGVPPIVTAARLVPEDLLLMHADEQGVYRLEAAALCFPTRWHLADKIGQPMDVIHAPVPGYQQQLGQATDRTLSALRVDRPVWRHNWALVDSRELYQPTRIPLPRPLTPDQLGDGLWLRTERQTLRRLPQSGRIVFGIRIIQATLADVCSRPALAVNLLEQLRTMAPALRGYKQLHSVQADLEDYIKATLAAH